MVWWVDRWMGGWMDGYKDSPDNIERRDCSLSIQDYAQQVRCQELPTAPHCLCVFYADLEYPQFSFPPPHFGWAPCYKKTAMRPVGWIS